MVVSSEGGARDSPQLVKVYHFREQYKTSSPQQSHTVVCRATHVYSAKIIMIWKMGKGNGKDCKEGAWESHTEIMEKAGA